MLLGLPWRFFTTRWILQHECRSLCPGDWRKIGHDVGMSAPAFQIKPLESMVAVGAVTSRSARLWLRAAHPGRVRVTVWPEGRQRDAVSEHFVVAASERDQTLSVIVPKDFPGASPLQPCTVYRFDVRAENEERIGAGRFETAPPDADSAPSKFAIAFASCHQPFDRQGRLAKRSLDMLTAVRKCFEQHDVKFFLNVGDQMYADYPAQLSLFDSNFFAEKAPAERCQLLDCSAAEVRRLYQLRHRLFFAPKEWQALHAEFPCYPILDDHEIIDNWGSDPAHQASSWKALGQGARQAYFDYQGSRVLGPSNSLPQHFGYTVEYGPIAVFVLDIRSQRRVNGDARLYSDDQFAEFERFLEQHEDKHALFVVLSVPPVHLPRWAVRIAAKRTSDGEDFSDRWSSAGHAADRDRLIKRLHRYQLEHPEKKVVILSGDIHIACAHELRWRNEVPPLYQLVSSGITHRDSWLWRIAAELSIRLNSQFATVDHQLLADLRLLPGRGATHNPYRTLNVGLVEIETPSPGATPSIRYLIYGHSGQEPKCVFRSDPL